MFALAVEISLVVAWFIWAHRRQMRDERRKQRLPAKQLRLPLEKDREVGGRRSVGASGCGGGERPKKSAG